MTVKRAKLVFAVLMQAAREGKHLTQYDKQQLSIARQTLRQIRKPISNPRQITTLQAAKTIAKMYGHRIKHDVDYNEYIITGPFFPTGYHTSELADLIGTLLFEVKRHEKMLKNQRIKAEHADVFIHNPPVMIYGKVNRVIATKTQKHICDTECKRHGHRYYHDFTSRAQMYGLPDGSILIKSK